MKSCSSCRRHLHRTEHTCPFCRAPFRDTAAPLAAVLSLASVLVGCTDDPGSTSGSTASSGSDDGTTRSSSTSMVSTTGAVDDSTGSTGTTVVSAGNTTNECTAGGGFIYGGPDCDCETPPDLCIPPLQCDVFAQDCPKGEQCMPWANDGSEFWNATRCVPVADDPAGPGEPCTVEGSVASGIDDCEQGSMCWEVDSETLTGTCVAMCTGSSDDPMCEEPQTACAIAADGALALCLTICDPVLQTCEPGQGCYPVSDTFLCTPDESDMMNGYGSDCLFINDCNPGLFCTVADVVPGCMGNVGCCSEFCDVTDPAGDAQCSGAAEGQQCDPWFAEGEAPRGLEHVGMCILP